MATKTETNLNNLVINYLSESDYNSALSAGTINENELYMTPTQATTDTKNTAGSTNTSNKIYLIGATSQAANPQTYSHDTAYVGTDGCLYSNSTKVSVEGHTHSYAGSSSAGGSATSAVKLDSSAGSSTQPVYFSSGKPVACTYTLGKSVPSNAVFTDTTYTSLKNPYALTLQGNGTTLTNGTYDGSAAKTVNITPSAIGAAPQANGQYAVTTSGDGYAYTATVTGISALSVGVSFIMIPNVGSESTSPTLNVNNLGAKNIRRRLSNMHSPQMAYYTSWLSSGIPYRVVYDGTYWIVEGQDKPAVADLYGLSATATELNYCSGVTSKIQTQLDNKASSSHTHQGLYHPDYTSNSIVTIGHDSNGYWFRPTDISAFGDVNAGSSVNPFNIVSANVLRTYDTNTTSNGVYARIYNDRIYRYSSSSKRYKENIKPIEAEEIAPQKLYDAEVVQFTYKDGYLIDEDPRNNKLISGFIVEDLEKIYPIAIDYNDDGEPEMWNVNIIVPSMLKLIQEQKKEINDLKARLDNLEINI